MRRIVSIPIFSLILFCAGLIPGTAQSQGTEYKEYKPAPARLPYFMLTYNNKTFRVALTGDSLKPTSRAYATPSLTVAGPRVVTGRDTIFDAAGLHFGDSILPYSQIRDIEISESDDGTIIRFFRSAQKVPESQMTRRGNRITFADSVSVGQGEFVRGTVFTVMGTVHVAGEVNRDVVSLFGPIVVSPSAVIRGDLATVWGSIVIAKTAQVYGDAYRPESKAANRRHRFMRKEHPVEPDGRLSYNRVDGFAPYLSVSYHDPDSLLPTARAEFGYAFASKRARFSLSAEQLILRQKALSVGAEYYRKLGTDDDWLLPDWENSVYAFMATEDFKDFYEAQGGTGFARITPVKALTFEARYRNEQTKWLHAHPNLWSVFGGEKQFPDNFASVPFPFRDSGMAQIDTGSNVTLSTSLTYDTRHADSLFSLSAWNASASLEWSSTGLKSDYNYRRYVLDIRRYQYIHKYSMLLLRAMIGSSDGYLPMNRRFFLGGPGSLYGYERKELMGTRFWMINAEYRFQIPKTEVAFGPFWDIAQVANNQAFSRAVEVKNSIGGAIYFGEQFRLSVAQRLDRSQVSPEVYIRLIPAF